MKKTLLLAILYLLSLITVVQAMENKKDIVFYSNSNNTIQIRSIININKKNTKLIIDNINGGIVSWDGEYIPAIENDPSSKAIGFNLKGTNTFGKILAFITIQNNKKAIFMEPFLEVGPLSCYVKPDLILAHHTIDLNGNEIWNSITILNENTAIQTTGLQQWIIKLKHEN